jgi:hypothetical protein
MTGETQGANTDTEHVLVWSSLCMFYKMHYIMSLNHFQGRQYTIVNNITFSIINIYK